MQRGVKRKTEREKGREGEKERDGQTDSDQAMQKYKVNTARQRAPAETRPV